MWINPKYADRYQAPSPPAEQGRRLATFPRGKGAEMRVVLAEYEGKPYVSLRLWEAGTDGGMWPVKGKGCSIRVSEIDGLVEALRQVEDLIGAPAPPSRQDDRPHRHPQARESTPAPAPAVRPGGAPFDEFEEN